MELTVNTFNKALLMDTNPMLLGNESLTDALNATFVTMNGNEVILQNDMGNRRVDKAFLPAGYEPVGIKEYGGIIYIASYNPITNKSQIGSFPSPLRTNSNITEGKAELNLSFESYSEEGLKFLKEDSKMIPLTTENYLHAGDKFTLYSDVLYDSNSNISNNITNFNNTLDGKIISPKNKAFTLLVGILNSQNEFVDITKSLSRWDKEKSELIEYTNQSELYQFNDGYFIAKSINLGNISDVDKERDKMAINTYVYKLVGPLYLKATLNHILEVSYNIEGRKSNGETILNITATFVYNCPDGLSVGDNIEDDDYLYYETGELNEIKNLDFDFYIKGEDDTYSVLKIEEDGKEKDIEPHLDSISYDKSTNLYTAKITKTYNPTQTGIIDYYFCVPVWNPTNSSKGKIYLKDFSEKGTLNTDLFYTGIIELKSWRFYNENNSTTIKYFLNAYPEEGKSFTDITMELKDSLSEGNSITCNKKLKPNNGSSEITLNWNTDFDSSLKSRAVYMVTLKYKISGEDDPRTIEDNNSIFILTTNLLNDCYSISSENYVSNYLYFINPPEDDRIKAIVNEKLTIKPNLKCELSDSIEKELDYNLTDNSIIRHNDNGKCYVLLLYDIESTLTLNASANYDLTEYPSYVDNSKPVIDIKASLEDLSKSEIYDKNGSTIDSFDLIGDTEDTLFVTIEYLSIFNTPVLANVGINIKYTFNCYNKYIAEKGTPPNKISNVFTSIRNPDIIKSLFDGWYGGIFLGAYGEHWRSIWGMINKTPRINSNYFDTTKAKDSVSNAINNIYYTNYYGSDKNENGTVRITDKPKNVNSIGDTIYSSFINDLHKVSSNLTFLYLFTYYWGTQNNQKTEDRASYFTSSPMNNNVDLKNDRDRNTGLLINPSDSYSRRRYCRVWWRNYNSLDWSLIDKIFGPFDDIASDDTLINGMIKLIGESFEDIKYCFYKEIDNPIDNRFYPPSTTAFNYNNLPSITKEYIINVTAVPENKNTVGNNLKFVYSDETLMKTLTCKENLNVKKYYNIFENIINNINDSVSNIDIDTGTRFDSEGNLLEIGQYYDKNYQKIIPKNLVISDSKIYCKPGYKASIIDHPYDFVVKSGDGEGHRKLTLYYNNLYVVSTPIS